MAKVIANHIKCNVYFTIFDSRQFAKKEKEFRKAMDKQIHRSCDNVIYNGNEVTFKVFLAFNDTDAEKVINFVEKFFA